MLSKYTSLHTSLQESESSLPDTRLMRNERKDLLKHIATLMETAESVEYTRWNSEQGVESLVILENLLKDCMKIIEQCRSDEGKIQARRKELSDIQKTKGGVFTSKKQLLKKNQKIQSAYESEIECVKENLKKKISDLEFRQNELYEFLVSPCLNFS